jgi:hypothetical protein
MLIRRALEIWYDPRMDPVAAMQMKSTGVDMLETLTLIAMIVTSTIANAAPSDDKLVPPVATILEGDSNHLREAWKKLNGDWVETNDCRDGYRQILRLSTTGGSGMFLKLCSDNNNENSKFKKFDAQISALLNIMHEPSEVISGLSREIDVPYDDGHILHGWRAVEFKPIESSSYKRLNFVRIIQTESGSSELHVFESIAWLRLSNGDLYSAATGREQIFVRLNEKK